MPNMFRIAIESCGENYNKENFTLGPEEIKHKLYFNVKSFAYVFIKNISIYIKVLCMIEHKLGKSTYSSYYRSLPNLFVLNKSV